MPKYKFIKINDYLNENSKEIFKNILDILAGTKITPKNTESCLDKLKEENNDLFKHFNKSQFYYILNDMLDEDMITGDEEILVYNIPQK